MKGKLLNKEEVLKLNGQYVYIIPKLSRFKENEGKAHVEITYNRIMIHPLNGDNAIWSVGINSDNNYFYNKYWLDIYEWTDDIFYNELQSVLSLDIKITYTAEEIVHKIVNKELQDDDILIDKNGNKDSIYDVLEQDISALIDYAPYTIAQRPIILTFQQALDKKYNYRKFKIKHKLLEDDMEYDNYDYLPQLLKYITDNYDDEDIRIILNEAKFYLKQE